MGEAEVGQRIVENQAGVRNVGWGVTVLWWDSD